MATNLTLFLIKCTENMELFIHFIFNYAMSMNDKLTGHVRWWTGEVQLKNVNYRTS
jgi:hypothetical protein